jgi:CheY-like chemotaxis protein
MDRVLAAEGFSPSVAGSMEEARAQLDAGGVELVIVDELAGGHGPLDEVRRLRDKYPSVPLVVTGALLSRREMQELVRLRVADALPKPFTPAELREAVARAVGTRAAHHVEALEFDAATTEARRAIASGALQQARPALARARAISPFDAETMALCALSAELAGDDDNAGRGYRAALALRDEEAPAPPDPREGLARLAVYGAARPVSALAHVGAAGPFWLVSDPVVELRHGPPPMVEGARAIVLALGLTAEGPGTLFFREGGPRALVIMAGAMRAETVAAALGQLGGGRVVAADPTRERLDLLRIEALLGEVRRAR